MKYVLAEELKKLAEVFGAMKTIDKENLKEILSAQMEVDLITFRFADEFATRLRSHAPLKDLDDALLCAYQILSDAKPINEETPAWLMIELTKVNLIAELIKADPFFAMPEGAYRIAKNIPQMSVLRALCDGIQKDVHVLQKTVGFTLEEVHFILLTLVASRLITRSRSGRTIQHELSTTGKAFLEAVDSCAGKAYGLS